MIVYDRKLAVSQPSLIFSKFKKDVHNGTQTTNHHAKYQADQADSLGATGGNGKTHTHTHTDETHFNIPLPSREVE